MLSLESLDTAKQKATELRDKARERKAEVRAKAGENLEKVNDVVNKLFLTDEDEYKHMKAIVGVVAGIVAGGFLYMLLYFFYHVNELIALYITVPFTGLLCLGLGLWTSFRAVVILCMYTVNFLLIARTLILA